MFSSATSVWSSIVSHMVIPWPTVGLAPFIFPAQRPRVISVFVRGALVAALWRIRLTDEVAATGAVGTVELP